MVEEEEEDDGLDVGKNKGHGVRNTPNLSEIPKEEHGDEIKKFKGVCEENGQVEAREKFSGLQRREEANHGQMDSVKSSTPTSRCQQTATNFPSTAFCPAPSIHTSSLPTNVPPALPTRVLVEAGCEQGAGAGREPLMLKIQEDSSKMNFVVEYKSVMQEHVGVTGKGKHKGAGEEVVVRLELGDEGHGG